MASPKPATVTATFVHEKETKNTVKFSEQPDPGTPPSVGTLYVQKHVIHQLGNPSKLTITITQ
jgi:hypothetical protein